MVAFSNGGVKPISGEALQAGDIVCGAAVTAAGAFEQGTSRVVFRRDTTRGDHPLGGRPAATAAKFGTPSRVVQAPVGCRPMARPKPVRRPAADMSAQACSPMGLPSAAAVAMAMANGGGVLVAKGALQARMCAEDEQVVLCAKQQAELAALSREMSAGEQEAARRALSLQAYIE